MLKHRTAGTIGLQIAYGEEVKDDKGLMNLSHEVMKVFGEVAMPGQFLVDTIPICESHSIILAVHDAIFLSI